jgi:hypothetical protein
MVKNLRAPAFGKRDTVGMDTDKKIRLIEFRQLRPGCQIILMLYTYRRLPLFTEVIVPFPGHYYYSPRLF